MVMAGTAVNGAATHFGRQMRKERIAHGWSIREFSERAGINAGHLSRIENGRRPPTEKLAATCDALFPGRRGWFTDWYQESRSWAEVPAGFRSWSELEDRATSLRVWSPGVIDGLLQTEDYARALLGTYPDVSGEAVSGRLAARMDRQRRVLQRDAPPTVWFVIDQLSLCRLVGSPDVMAAQLQHIAAVAVMPRITVQLLPAIAHPATPSGFIVTDDSAWCEHVAGGFAYTGGETVTSLQRLFDSLRTEAHRGSESLAMIERMAGQWETGASPATAAPTAASA